jgi:LAGLIDADG DNA endonuclease family/NADH-Ubiquinone oxidoreductase (complex I), chain 5 N-terminus
MYLSILILPLLGSLISGFMGRKIGVTGSQFITITCLIISSILASIAFYEVGLSGSPVYINLGNWIDSEFLLINWEFSFDQITVAMLIPVLYISTLIHIYSISYMSEDPHIPRFFSYLSGFTASMLLILCSGNYFVLFVGWEGDLYCLKWIQELYFIENKLSLIAILPNKRLFHTEGKIHSHKRIGPHNLNVIQVIIGSLLGDGHLEKRAKGIGSRLIIEQTNRNVEYLMWFYQFFNEKGYCSNKKPKLFKRIRKNNVIYFGYRFNTYTFSSLNWLHELFYSDNNIKRLPISFLYEYLNPMALAIWFMGDGSKLGVGLKIATNCFIKSELEELCKLFYIKYKLNCSIQKNTNDWVIYIKKNSAQDFCNLIEPYMLNSMKYKLGIYSQYIKIFKITNIRN